MSLATLSSRSMTRLETVEISQAGPGGGNFIGGEGIFSTVGQLTNTTGMTPMSTTSGTVAWPGVTGQFSTVVFTAAPGTMTLQLPLLPLDGQVAEIINGSAGAATALTVATNDGSTLVNGGSVATLAAGASAEYRYLLSTNSWYRMR